MSPKIPVREHTGNMYILTNTGNTLYAQVVDSLIVKILETEHLCQVSFAYEMVTNHLYRHRENLQSDRENTGNLKIKSELGLV